MPFFQGSPIKKHTHHILLARLAAWILPISAGAVGKLVPGKDRIDTPAIGSGLCVIRIAKAGFSMVFRFYCRVFAG